MNARSRAHGLRVFHLSRDDCDGWQLGFMYDDISRELRDDFACRQLIREMTFVINKYLVTLVFLAGAIHPTFGHAADVFLEKHNLNIVGEIRSGDAERVAKSAIEQVIRNRKIISRIVVNTPGGDIGEAIRIADLVAGMKPTVAVARGGVCASSCFLIFLAGYERVASWARDDGSMPTPEKRASRLGLVGVHRPYLKAPSADLESVRKQEELMRKFRSHLASLQVPQYLVDEMMARPSNDIYWLRDRDSDLIGPFSAGDEEALIAKCGYKRTGRIVDEQWSVDRIDKMNQCSFDYWDEQYLEPQIRFVVKLSTGWRPWFGSK